MQRFRSIFCFGFFCLTLSVGASMPVMAQQSSANPSGAAIGGTSALPKDVDPESLCRLPFAKREDMDEAGKAVFDDVAGDARSTVKQRGPAGMRLHSPKNAEYSRPFIRYLRFETKLGPRLTELAILVVAREMDSQFEWSAHEPAGLKNGLKQEVIDIVKYRKPVPAGMDEKEAAIILMGRELFRIPVVTSETYAQAAKAFNREQLVDLVALIGQYVAADMFIKAFDQQLLDGQTPLLPLP